MTDTHAQPATTPAQHLDGTPTGYEVRTDRPCARCGFNLFGQTIVREPHYNLVSVRCPECGQLAALQEYPALGKWADRWARLIAAAWIASILATLTIAFAGYLGFYVTTLENAGQKLSLTIATEYLAFQQAENAANPVQQYVNNPGPWISIDEAWWADNRADVMARTGGPWKAINWRSNTALIPQSILSFAFGAFISVVLLGARHRTTLLVAAIPLAAAVAVAYVANDNFINTTGTILARQAANAELRGVVYAVATTASLISLAVGVLSGRKLARLLVRLSLPPRLRTSLSILWTRDNLPPPRPNPAANPARNPDRATQPAP